MGYKYETDSIDLGDKNYEATEVSPGGDEVNLQDKNAIPTTEAQVVEPDEGYQGLRSVAISAVTALIDQNIVAGNIKNGIEILGVTGNYTGIVNKIPALLDRTITSLTAEDTDGATQLKTSLQSIRSLTSFACNTATLVESNVFSSLYHMTSLSIPNVVTIKDMNIFYCDGLVNLELPKVETIGPSCVSSCTNLERIDFGALKTMGNSCFNYCGKLATIIFRGNALVPMGNNCFTNSKLAQGTGYLYVKDELVDTYKADAKWSTYANQIKGISELPE